MNQRERAILAEYVRRESARLSVLSALRAQAFPAQLKVLDDPARLKSILCSRRAGKSRACALGLLEAAYRAPYSACLYVGLTRLVARSIIWEQQLEPLNRELKLWDAKAFNKSELRLTLPNGSTITILGMDSDAREADKALGQALTRVVIDEAASFRVNLRKLVYETIRPATADRGGDIWLAGTPGDMIGPPSNRHLFYAVTTGEEPGWSNHKWTTFDNPHMERQWRAELAEIQALRPLFLETPDYRRMYLGEWAVDLSRLVYRYQARNAIARAPDCDHYVIGVDLGYEDSTSWVVCGWREHDPTLYILRAYKRQKLIISEVADETKALQRVYQHAKLVVDGANKQAVEEMRQRHELAFQPADKAGKADFIRLFNNDLITKRTLVVAEDAEPLLTEWSTLLWDERKIVPTELASCENHCADAALYGWRYARAFLAEPKEEKPARGSEQAVEEFWRQKARTLEEDYADDDAA